jgi:cytochrome b pre-mRNA-processing protein 3
MLNVLGKSGSRRRRVEQLYAAAVARARAPVFFARLGVPDTIDGRFDLLVLHAWLVLDRLRQGGPQDLSQGFTDAIFIGFDEGLRDLGAGDMGIGRRMKKMADAFYGRLQAYGASGDLASMTESVARNLYRGAADGEHNAEIVARYALAARERLSHADMTTDDLDFGPLPEPQE